MNKNDPKLAKLSDEELISMLQWDDIPDTRAIQQERIDSIGKQSWYEEHMQKLEEVSLDPKSGYYYGRPDMRFSNTKRLVQLPHDKLKEVYSLAIPLAVPLGDFSVKSGVSKEWVSWDFQKGAMHLTTPQGLEKLLAIFNEYGIPVKDAEPYAPICRFGRETTGIGKVVPHSWYADTWDPYEALFEHQFVAAERKVFLVPYVIIERGVTYSEKRELHIDCWVSENISTIAYRDFHTRTAAFCEEHLSNAEDWIRRKYAQEDKAALEEKREDKVLEAETIIAKINEPVLIYDPAWIKL